MHARETHRGVREGARVCKQYMGVVNPNSQDHGLPIAPNNVKNAARQLGVPIELAKWSVGVHLCEKCLGVADCHFQGEMTN